MLLLLLERILAAVFCLSLSESRCFVRFTAASSAELFSSGAGQRKFRQRLFQHEHRWRRRLKRGGSRGGEGGRWAPPAHSTLPSHLHCELTDRVPARTSINALISATRLNAGQDMLRIDLMDVYRVLWETGPVLISDKEGGLCQHSTQFVTVTQWDIEF